GIEVGFSELRLDDPTAVSILTDILGEVAELTPGPWLHVGGDEPLVIPGERYATSVATAEKLVRDVGKKAIGWNESVRGVQDTRTVIQHWDYRTELAALANAARQGHRVIMSPAAHVYLDMKYTADYAHGQDWAGLIEVAESYEWDPATNVPNLDANQILGIEATVWTEKIHTREAMLEMLLPRLASIAEIAWSPRLEQDRELAQIAPRLAAQAARWERKDWPFYRSPQVDWSAAE
ncbi:MAG TPA: family 20 glycosylhydrolase, partial [Actinomycetales bacterium]|nr:family 20 glycosylhydrolase [Actinomycetales bacterium]